MVLYESSGFIELLEAIENLNTKEKIILVAMMPWGGYNQEDAIIMSERAAKRGLFTHTVFRLPKNQGPVVIKS